MSDKNRVKLLIATFNVSVYSETFIRQHINSLPFPIAILSGEGLTIADDGVDICSRSLLRKGLAKISEKITNSNYLHFRNQQVANHLKRNSITVVLAEYGHAATSMMDACALAEVPLVAHFHGLDAHDNDVVEVFRKEYKKLFEKAAAIIGVSREMCLRLKELGAPEEKVHYVPYYVDPGEFCEVEAGANPPNFLSIGRFVEKKAPHLTLLAFERVLSRAPDARLDMIGDGPLLGPTRQMAKAIGIEEAVRFHGARTHSFVSQSMKKTRVYVQHSLCAVNGDSEGTPVSILEAQASGLPVVSTRHTGIKDVVLEGETGFLVDECDVEAMSQHMLDLTIDRDLATRLGNNGAKRAREVFGADQTINKLAAIISEVSSTGNVS